MKRLSRHMEFLLIDLTNFSFFAAIYGEICKIENEYNMVLDAFREGGKRYVQWAGDLTLSTGAEVPWMMCKQNDASCPIINACNGRNCDDSFTGPNNKSKPILWAENWTAQYRVFGDPPAQRSTEDLAYDVARFFSKRGTLVNYYMYHGGTNFGRTDAAFVMTRYYEEAPLDESSMYKEPNWGHLRDLHHALRLMKKALLWKDPSMEKLGNDLEVSKQSSEWGHQAGLLGEKEQIYNEPGTLRVKWVPDQKGIPVTCYKRYFDTPYGDDPVVLDMGSMGKGMVWINGENIGRYWCSYLSPLDKPSQQVYHVPRSFLKPENNLMVVLEESGGDPEGILVIE